MRRLIIISSSGLTLLFLAVLAWGVWTVGRAPLVTAGLPWAHEQQQDGERKAKAAADAPRIVPAEAPTAVKADEERKTKAAAEARRLPEERMRLAASDKAADEAEARRKVEEQQELAPPAVFPPFQGSPIGARGRNTDVPTSLAGAPLPPFLVFTSGPIPPSLVTPGPLPPSLVFTPGPLPPPSSLGVETRNPGQSG